MILLGLLDNDNFLTYYRIPLRSIHKRFSIYNYLFDILSLVDLCERGGGLYGMECAEMTKVLFHIIVFVVCFFVGYTWDRYDNKS